MGIPVIYLLTMMVLFSHGAFVFGAELKDGGSGKVPGVWYGFDLEMMYLGEFKGLSSSRAAAEMRLPLAEEDQGASGYRTFGLRRARFDFDWSLPRGSSLEIRLRPDSVNYSDRNRPQRELDTRSGKTVEPMPSVHLLDEYRLRLRRSGVDAYAGVKGDILEDYTVGPNLLGFGLRVLGPMKVFAAGISLPGVIKFYGDNGGSSDGLGFGLDFLSGRDDRHDGRAGDVSGVGESPGKAEPYWGAAIHLDSQFAELFKLGIAGAGIEERSDGGKKRLEWYQIGLKRNLHLGPVYKFLVGLEARQLREAYEVDLTEISDVSLTSFGLSSAFSFMQDQSVYLSLWSATGNIHLGEVYSTSQTTRALQVDLGWKWLLEEQLDLVAALSREWRRDGSIGGGTVGGFQGDLANRSTQSRVALQLNYKFGGQL